MTLTVIASGREISGYTGITITRSILSATNSFQIEYQGDAPRELDMTSPVQIKWSGTTIFTGYVEQLAFGSRATDRGKVRGGRSITCDLVDSSAGLAKGSVRDATLQQIANLLAEPYAASVIVKPPPGQEEPIRKYRVEPGETVVDAIRRLADPRQMLVWTSDSGDLIVSRATNEPPRGVLIAPRDFTGYSGRVDFSQRFSAYVVLGQSFANDAWSEVDAARAKGTAKDAAFQPPRERRKTIVAQRQASADRCQAQATWERQTRAGRSYTLTAERKGWIDPTDIARGVWTPNRVYRIRAPDEGDDFDHLLTDVQLRMTSTDRTASLTFASALAYATDSDPAVLIK